MQKRQAEAQELMQYAQSKQLPDDEARVIEERMARLQMEMEDIQAKESEGVMKKESEMQKELLAKVQEFLKTYTKEKGIDYVVNYQEGTQFILYGNNAYDITTDVINRLNVLYEEEKKNEKK
jgi:Skp family chaperone for outer membrane proteins